MTDRIWRLERGEGPIVAAAIHDGHHVRQEVQRHLALDPPSRLREEDPWTVEWAAIAPTRVVGLRSRFEVDLNRPRESAVYRTPEDAWGLQVWKGRLPDDVAERSLAQYDAFYQALREIYDELARRYGCFVVYDLHSYNHRRQGPEGPLADPQANPQVNVGTRTMKNRERFAGVIERFIKDLSDFDFPSGRLDVRENVRFFGGQHPRWAHETFPESACVLAIEVKKFFMDEWNGEPDRELLNAVRAALAATMPGVMEELAKIAGQRG